MTVRAAVQATTRVRTVDSPVGKLTLSGFGNTLTGLTMEEQRYIRTFGDNLDQDDGAFPDAVAQLTAYFAGELRTFDIDMVLEGTEFQKSVWCELGKIPYAETISYGEQARRVGNPKASRAVGLANGRLPIAIIVPCHRVVGSNGQLTGFGGGLGRKAWLLEHERAHN